MKGAKTSAVYVREFRERMRRSGLVKKEVWIRPEYAEDMAAVEKKFRQMPGGAPAESSAANTWQAIPGWTLAALQQAIETSPLAQAGSIQVARVEGADPALSLVMHDYGDLPIFVAVGGLQIVVQALMWPVEHINDPASFNTHVLRTHKLVPLTTIGIEPVAGVPCYIMFGALDTHASLANILFEIETLAENVIASVDAYRSFLREGVMPRSMRSHEGAQPFPRPPSRAVRCARRYGDGRCPRGQRLPHAGRAVASGGRGNAWPAAGNRHAQGSGLHGTRAH